MEFGGRVRTYTVDDVAGPRPSADEMRLAIRQVPVVTAAAAASSQSMAAAMVVLCGACGGQSAADPPPDVTGQELDEALAKLQAAGFPDSDFADDVSAEEDKVDVVGGGTFGVVDPAGWIVCKQVPAPEQPIEHKIVLTARRSYDCEETAGTKVTVPDVTGKVLSQAEAAFEDAGFEFLPDTRDATKCGRTPFDSTNWRVVSQRPKAGKKVRADTKPLLSVKKINEPCGGD